MPEYTTIQTYARYDKKNPLLITDQCRVVLKKLGLSSDSIEHWLSQMAWIPDEDWFVYTGSDCETILIGKVSLKLYTIGWTRASYPAIQEAWIEFGLLIETESIDDFSTWGSTWEYKDGVEEELWKVISIVSDTFTETGVYLTNEGQDGKPFEGYIENDKHKLWDFELAYIPNQLSSYYDPVPTDFQRVVLKKGSGIARTKVWKTLPWLK